MDSRFRGNDKVKCKVVLHTSIVIARRVRAIHFSARKGREIIRADEWITRTR
jgi:hypothetical protein